MPPRLDPVYDSNNPNPTINRATSTRRFSQMATTTEPQDPKKTPTADPSTSSKGKAKVGGASSSLAPIKAAPSRPSSTASSPAPEAHRRLPATNSKASTPTAASAARSIHAPQPKPVPFGTNEQRLPSHMMQTGQRAPLQRALGVASGSRPGSAYVSATSNLGDLAPSPKTDVEGLPSAGPSPTLRSTVSEESDLGPSSLSPTAPEVEPSGESITAALDDRRARFVEQDEPSPEPFFQGMGRVINLYKEPLFAAVARYHGAYDPASSSQEDPLLEFGAISGELENYSSAASAALRDALMRYDRTHVNLDWDGLPDLLSKAMLIDTENATLIPGVDAETNRHYFCLNLKNLTHLAHAVVAVQQILEALTLFLDRDPNTSFVLDPGYSFLYMTEHCEVQVELRYAVSVLQMRLDRANHHILLYFQSIRETLVDESLDERISSVDSTISEVRKEFGSQHPTKELYRLLLRKEYADRAALINREALEEIRVKLGEEPRPRYYKPRTRHSNPTAIPTVREQPIPTQTQGDRQTVPPTWFDPAATRGEVPPFHGVRFTSPTPLLSAVSALPGQG
ncbi:hypothetical protein R3P38DRAFT_2510740, partial [Favolaschia claudopus]